MQGYTKQNKNVKYVKEGPEVTNSLHFQVIPILDMQIQHFHVLTILLESEQTI